MTWPAGGRGIHIKWEAKKRSFLPQDRSYELETVWKGREEERERRPLKKRCAFFFRFLETTLEIKERKKSVRYFFTVSCRSFSLFVWGSIKKRTCRRLLTSKPVTLNESGRQLWRCYTRDACFSWEFFLTTSDFLFIISSLDCSLRFSLFFCFSSRFSRHSFYHCLSTLSSHSNVQFHDTMRRWSWDK